MVGAPVLDVAIGIVFVFLLVSLICSELGDKVSTWLGWRAKDLEAGLLNFIVGKSHQQIVDELYKVPLVQTLVPEDTLVTKILRNSPLSGLVYPGGKPISISAQTFWIAFRDCLLKTLVPDAQGNTSFDKIADAVNKMPADSPIKDSLLSIIRTADGQIETVRKNFETWYDNTLYKTTVIYRRNMWGFALLTAALISIFLNVDTIAVGVNLWRDSALRQTVVASASEYVKQPSEKDKAYQELEGLRLPIGWQFPAVAAGTPPFFGQCVVPTDWQPPAPVHSFTLFGRCIVPNDWTQPGQVTGFWACVFKIVGWAITAVAGAQGAPFWFDVLRKLTQKS